MPTAKWIELFGTKHTVGCLKNKAICLWNLVPTRCITDFLYFCHGTLTVANVVNWFRPSQIYYSGIHLCLQHVHRDAEHRMFHLRQLSIDVFIQRSSGVKSLLSVLYPGITPPTFTGPHTFTKTCNGSEVIDFTFECGVQYKPATDVDVALFDVVLAFDGVVDLSTLQTTNSSAKTVIFNSTALRNHFGTQVSHTLCTVSEKRCHCTFA